jgi:hypothetical protein
MENNEIAEKSRAAVDNHLKSLSEPVKRHALLAAHEAVANLLGLDKNQIKVSGLQFAVHSDEKMESHFFETPLDCTCHTPDNRCCGFGVVAPGQPQH